MLSVSIELEREKKDQIYDLNPKMENKKALEDQ